MIAHLIHLRADGNDSIPLIDEEFDTFDIRMPMNDNVPDELNASSCGDEVWDNLGNE